MPGFWKHNSKSQILLNPTKCRCCIRAFCVSSHSISPQPFLWLLYFRDEQTEAPGNRASMWQSWDSVSECCLQINFLTHQTRHIKTLIWNTGGAGGDAGQEMKGGLPLFTLYTCVLFDFFFFFFAKTCTSLVIRDKEKSAKSFAFF